MDTFDANVHRARIAKAQELMKQDGIAALLFTSEANVRYFTGYTSHRWAQPTSPQFGILAQTGDPTLIVNSIEMDRAGSHPWLRSVRDGAPDFAKQVVAAIHDVGAANGRIAAELGSILRVCMPYKDFTRVHSLLPNAVFIDGSDLLWALRMIKLPGEVELMQKACEITGNAIEDLYAASIPGKSEFELYTAMSQAVMKYGSHRLGLMPLGSRTPGEFHQADSSLRMHTNRKIMAGDLVWVDAYAIVGGYWTDTLRMYSIGKAKSESKHAYATVNECVEATIGATRAGVSVQVVMEAFRKVINGSKYREFGSGRFRSSGLAHGIGLDLIEPPFINQIDQEFLQVGMVLTIEPFLYQPDVGFFMIEEQVLVTETGCEVLSHRAPSQLLEV